MPTPPPLHSREDDDVAIVGAGTSNDDEEGGEGAEVTAQFDGADDDEEDVVTPPGSRVEGGTVGAGGVEVEVEAGVEVEVEDEGDPGGGTAGESSSPGVGREDAKVRKGPNDVSGGRSGGSGRRRTKRSWVHRYFSPMSGGSDDDDGVVCDLCSSRDDKDKNDERGKGRGKKRTRRGGGRLGVYSAGSSSTTLALHLRNVHDLVPPASPAARKGGSDGYDDGDGTGRRGRRSGMKTTKKRRKNERRGRPVVVTSRRSDERIRRRGRRTRVAPPSVEQQSEESDYGSEASSSQESDTEEESGVERRSERGTPRKRRRRGEVDRMTSQRNEKEEEHDDDDATEGKGKRRRRMGAKRSWVHRYFFRPAESDADGDAQRDDELNGTSGPRAAKAVVLCGLCRDADADHDLDLDLSPDPDGGSKRRSKHRPRAGVYSAGSSLTTLASHLEKVHDLTEEIHNEGNVGNARRLRRRRGCPEREREADGGDGDGDGVPTRRRHRPHHSTRRDRIRRRSEGASSAQEGEDSTGEESAAATGGREVAAGASRKRSRRSTDGDSSGEHQKEHSAPPEEEDPEAVGDDTDLIPTKRRRTRGRGVGTRTKRSWVHHYFKPVVAVAAAGEDGEEEGSSAVTHVACDLCRGSSSSSTSEVTQVGRGTTGVYSVGSSNTTLASHLERVHSLTERMHRERTGGGDEIAAGARHSTSGEAADGGDVEKASSPSMEGHRAPASTEKEEGQGWRSPPAGAAEAVTAPMRGGVDTGQQPSDTNQWVAVDATRTPLRSAKARSWVHGYFQSINLVHRDAPTGKPHAVCGLCYPEPSIPHPSLFECGRRRRGGRGRTGPNGTSNPLGVYSLGTSSSTFANHLERVHKLTERLHLANRARMRMSETAGENAAADGGNGDRDVEGEEEDEDEGDLLPRHQPLSEYDQAWLNVSYVENLVVRDQQPFTTSTRRGSQRFMRELNPRYVPCSASFVNWILDELHDLVVRVEGEMVSAGGTDAVAEAAQGEGGGIKKKRGRSSGVASSRLRSAMHSSTEQKLKNCRSKLHLLEQDLKNINRSRVADGGERISWREYLSERLPYLQGKSKVKLSKRRPVTKRGKKCFV